MRGVGYSGWRSEEWGVIECVYMYIIYTHVCVCVLILLVYVYECV